MYKSCLDNLKVGECLLIQDFSINRDIFFQNEIKSSYWTKQQVTVHPTVIYFRDKDGKLHRLVITHLSDITKHDAHIVFYMTKDCIEYMTKTFSDIKWQTFYIWSDGCTSQYKGRTSFYYLDKFQVDVQRNFFGSEHGKGESDGETGKISRQLSDAVKSQNAVLHNASDMCNFLIDNNKDKDVRIFALVIEDDLKNIYSDFTSVSIKTLCGKCTRSLHQIKPSQERGVMLTRPFSCFCNKCLASDFQNCQNKTFTLGKFTAQELPSNDTNDKCNADDEVEECEDNYINAEDDLFNETEDVLDQIRIQKEKLKLKDLEANDFVIASLKNGTKFSYFVAKINKVVNTNNIVIDYLKQNFDHPDVFHKTDIYKENNYAIKLTSLVMKLPKPVIYRRGNKYTFCGKISLKNI